MVKTIHSENMKALAKKLREEIDFNRFVCFDPVTFDLLPLGPKNNGHHPWSPIYLTLKFGEETLTGRWLNRSAEPPIHPTKIRFL